MLGAFDVDVGGLPIASCCEIPLPGVHPYDLYDTVLNINLKLEFHPENRTHRAASGRNP